MFYSLNFKTAKKNLEMFYLLNFKTAKNSYGNVLLTKFYLPSFTLSVLTESKSAKFAKSLKNKHV